MRIEESHSRFAGRHLAAGAAFGRWAFYTLFWFGLVTGAQAALTRLDISYYTDYAVDVRVGNHNEKVYASALTASYMPGAHGGAESAPLPAGYPSGFTAFCLDIRYDLAPESYWQPGPLPGNNANGSHDHVLPLWEPGGIYRAAGLYEAYAGDVNASTSAGKLAGAALQLAIWDVLYGDGLAVNHRHSGFYVEGKFESELVFAANAMLASPANSLDFDTHELFWDAVLGPNGRRPLTHNQDLLGPALLVTGVPEASTCIAGGAALGYLLVMGRRRWKF